MVWHPHVTVATVVERDNLFLMVEEVDAGRTVFNQPAGHLEEGESLLQAARRETLEETAWRVTPTALLGVYCHRSPYNGVTYIRHCFIAEADGREAYSRRDEDILAVHWLDRERILDPGFPARSPMVARALEDYVRGVHHSLDVIVDQL